MPNRESVEERNWHFVNSLEDEFRFILECPLYHDLLASDQIWVSTRFGHICFKGSCLRTLIDCYIFRNDCPFMP